MKEITEILSGGVYAELSDKFDMAIVELQEKHQEYFEEKPSKYKTDKHDKLINHIRLDYNGMTTVTMWFAEDSDLREDIHQEVTELFITVFKGRN